MPISRHDIERACDHFDRANGRVANHGGERIKKWLREQGLSFWDRQFHRLYGQVLQDRMPLTKDDGVQVRVQTSNEATVLPENDLPPPECRRIYGDILRSVQHGVGCSS